MTTEREKIAINSVVQKENRYKIKITQALELLERIAEESGLYDEEKTQAQEAVELLSIFINNRI